MDVRWRWWHLSRLTRALPNCHSYSMMDTTTAWYICSLLCTVICMGLPQPHSPEWVECCSAEIATVKYICAAARINVIQGACCWANVHYHGQPCHSCPFDQHYWIDMSEFCFWFIHHQVPVLKLKVLHAVWSLQESSGSRFSLASQCHLRIPIPGAYLGLKPGGAAMMYSPILMQQLASKWTVQGTVNPLDGIQVKFQSMLTVCLWLWRLDMCWPIEL